MYDERRVRERKRLIDHMEYFVGPPASFYEDLEHAIECAARGIEYSKVIVGDELLAVGEVIAKYDLGEFVERKRNPEADEEAGTDSIDW